MTESFSDESAFEAAVIKALQSYGWGEVLDYKTESELIDNWADILFRNNRDIDRLNDCPLTPGEKTALINSVKALPTPFDSNRFFMSRSIQLIRDNPKDPGHLGKYVSLRNYDRAHVAGGMSVYQIARQPRMKSDDPMKHDRRGDIMLLINGMPVIHIELKRSGVPASNARDQIQKYLDEGGFTGLFSLVQVFVAMSPEECMYFANPGSTPINPKFCFRWTDFNNRPYTNWRDIVRDPLSIPSAHKMIGFYTVPDRGEMSLKVMRSYQIEAVEQIWSRIERTHWTMMENRGGYVYHTTGSGKTLTSFKAASIIAGGDMVDKALFLADRRDLGYQTLNEYRNFAAGGIEVQDTDDTDDLLNKLISSSVEDRFIVTSFQKMGRLAKHCKDHPSDMIRIQGKRIAVIIDECHRSTFGSTLMEIKDAFPTAIYFGFTGTPIYDENSRGGIVTKDLFGDELCRYTIADGLRDGNVLGFDVRKHTMDEDEVRLKVAESECGCSRAEAMADPVKKDLFLYWTDRNRTTMLEVEDKLPNAQFREPGYREGVVDDILKEWDTVSYGGRHHAIFATSSIPEAIEYYGILRERKALSVTAVFNDDDDDSAGAFQKNEAIRQIIEDYNDRFSTAFGITEHEAFSKDVVSRLSHKGVYRGIEDAPDEQLNLVIVVNQLLTGFDSKWVNALYLDKILANEHLIQAFSRTNRILDEHKPFGVIKYYRRPFLMEKNIRDAFELYSGEHASEVFVSDLMNRLTELNITFDRIKTLFRDEGIQDYSALPEGRSGRRSFGTLFPRLRNHVISARIQGFKWGQTTYIFQDRGTISVELMHELYLILKTRYSEIFHGGGGKGSPDEATLDIDPTISRYDAERIDFDYLDTRFNAFRTALMNDVSPEECARIQREFSESVAILSQNDQRIASTIIGDLRSGKLMTDFDESFRSILLRYRSDKMKDQIHSLSVSMGLNEQMLRDIVSRNPKNDAELYSMNQMENLINGMDRGKARIYLEKMTGESVLDFLVPIKARIYLRNFIINGGFNG